MSARLFALVVGLVFLALGVCGFVPALVVAPTDYLPPGLAAGSGLLFGLFQVNALRDLLHLFFGVWGVVVWRVTAASRAYARAVAIVFSALTLIGVLPGLAGLLSALPVEGHDVWLDALLAAVASAVGFVPWWTMRRDPAGGGWS